MPQSDTDHEEVLLLPERQPPLPQTRRFWLVCAATVAMVGTVGVLQSRGRQGQQAVSADFETQQQFLMQPKEKDAEKEDSDEEEAADKPKSAKHKKKKAEHKKDDKVSSKKAIEDAEHLTDKAASLKEKADDLKHKAGKLSSKSEDFEKEAEETEKKASDEKASAEEDRKKAAELREQVKELSKEAKELDVDAADLKKDAERQNAKAAKEKESAHLVEKKAKKVQSNAEADEKAAVSAEEKALDEVAAQRMCIKLPGVKLRGEDPKTFPPVVGQRNFTDEWKCTDWCQKHLECKQAVFTWETKTCELFGTATADPISFREMWPWFNSSYCDVTDGKDNMLAMLKKVFDQKPWVPPPHNCSWAGDNCIETGCCADVCKADWHFDKCSWYTCWKRDEYWAGCELDGAPADWDGTKLGGHPNSEIDPVPEGVLVQGTKLFCFSVVMWDQGPEEGWMSSEGEIAGHWKDAGKGIMQCDDHAFFDGLGGGSVHNIQSFIEAWKKVQDDGRWKQNDWTIKVDPDAVFFPDHFRTKVQYVWRTPQGSAVYLRNTGYKFQFLGALEALTREALEQYFLRGWECESHLTQEGGEDYWLLQCLEGIGVNYQTDVALLHDKYAKDENCGDPNGVAHHFFKKIVDWDACWDIANDAWNNAHQGQ